MQQSGKAGDGGGGAGGSWGVRGGGDDSKEKDYTDVNTGQVLTLGTAQSWSFHGRKELTPVNTSVCLVLCGLFTHCRCADH